MRSIKPGRAPSWGGVVMGLVFAVFGIIWTIGASANGAPAVFTLFGVIVVMIAIGGIAYNLHNATSKNRFSDFDITDQGEENDPFEPGSSDSQTKLKTPSTKSKFCPYCGTGLKAEYIYCPKCGRDV